MTDPYQRDLCQTASRLSVGEKAGLLALPNEGARFFEGAFEDLHRLWLDGLVACNQNSARRRVWPTPRGIKIRAILAQSIASQSDEASVRRYPGLSSCRTKTLRASAMNAPVDDFHQVKECPAGALEAADERKRLIAAFRRARRLSIGSVVLNTILILGIFAGHIG
ncbi:MAG: hypothetical protein CL949_20450 [Erythrobacter sp.]|nr:hypothetical protein [Erythrobacter sp.]